MELSSEGVVNAADLKSDDGDRGAPVAGQKRVIRQGKIPGSEAPVASDPRWMLFAEWADKPVAYSQGLGAYKDFENQEATFVALANAFLNTRWVRESWRDKKTGETKSGKDGIAVSGAVLKLSKAVADMTEAEKQELEIGEPDEPGKFQKNFRDKNVDRVEGLICFDLDGKPGDQPMPPVRGVLRERQLSASGYTTHSHKVEHEKWRIVLYLKYAIPTGTAEERAVYSRTYHLIGKALFGAIPYDPSCANPARVIYQPSHDGVSPVASWFEPGVQLDPTPFVEQARAEIAAEAAQRKSRKSATANEDADYQALLKQVRAKITKYKTRLNLPAFFGDGTRSKIHITCPWAAEHTDGKDSGQACAVWAPDASETGAAHVFCQHGHCKDAHGPGQQRTVAEFVTREMVQRDPPVGIEVLLEHVEWTEQERETRSEHTRRRAEWTELAELGADRKALMAAIGDLKPEADSYYADLDRVLCAVSTVTDPITMQDAERALKRPPVGLNVVRTREVIEQKRHLRAADCRSLDADDDADVVHVPIAPRTQEEICEYDREIISSWDLPLQLAIARSQIRRRNEAAPRLFTRKGDPIALRLSDADGRLTLAEPDADAWSDEMVDLVQFRRINNAVDRIAGMPAELIGPLKGSPAKLGLPIVEGIIRTPLFGPNGELITARGYNKGLKLILDPNDVFDPPSRKPSDDEVREAVAILENVICDFPFSDCFTGEEPLPYKIGEPDAAGYRETNFERGYGTRWNVWGAMLHPQIRHLMPDGSSAPPYHIDKAQPGEGAGYLMNSINIVLTGRELSVRVYDEKNPENFEKAIPAAMRAGDPMIGIDNVIGTIRSGPLAAVMTAGEFIARKFGTNSEEMRLPTTAMWMFAGNNARFSDELTDRMVPIRLDSGLTKPAKERDARKNEYFKYPQPYAEYVKSVRRRVVWALHTLIARWFVDGRPGAKIMHPRFPEYSAVVGGILENAARICEVACGFLSNLDAYKDATNEDANAFAAVYQRLIDRFADHGTVMFSMSEAVDALRDPFSKNLDPDLNLPISGRTPHGEVCAFAGLFRDELRQRPFDVKVSGRIAARHGWPVLVDLGDGQVLTRLKFVRGGKTDAERWRAVPVEM